MRISDLSSDVCSSDLFLNRCNRSGIIINGGPIGGVQQSGAWKLDARFNKDDLRRRCEKVAEFRDRVEVSGRDALDFIDSIDASKTLLFIDPPYFMKGSLLSLILFNAEYHQKIADKMRSLQSSSWVKIGRAHVSTPVTNAQLVCRLMLEKKH